MRNSSKKSPRPSPTDRDSRSTRTPGNAGKRYPAEVLSREEVRLLMAACSRRAPTGLRNRAAVGVLYRTGLRVSELLALKTKDIDRKASTLRVLRGKGKKARTVGIDAGAVALLDEWLTVRASRGIKGSAPIICTLRGGPVSPEYMRQMLKRMAKRAGIDRRVHPHMLRHSFAVELVGEGVPMPIIQRLLGHSSLSTTATYLQGLRPQQAIDAIRARPAWTSDAGGGSPHRNRPRDRSQAPSGDSLAT